MNQELLKRMNDLGIDINTNKAVLTKFLTYHISKPFYDGIEGYTLDGKVDTVYNYLHNISKEPIVKKTLNIVIADNSSSLEYIAFLEKKYTIIVHKSEDVKNPQDIDLVLFTGGEDVNPTYYFEKTGKYTSFNETRDRKELEVFEKFRNNSFLLGVCRGSQFLTVLSGGKLIQHVEGHCKDHSILVNGQRYQITSSHHQMLYPFDLNKNSYELIAHSEYFQSKTYLNGNDEEIELPKGFLEPEIIYYNYTNALCIQGHPEWSHCSERTSDMCLNLIDKYMVKDKPVRLSTSTYRINNFISPPNEDEDESWGVDENEDEEEL